MPVPVTIVASGGLPVSESATGTPMTPTDGTTDNQPLAMPVTIVADGGMPVNFVKDDLSDYP
jgi:hypothetical protein